MVQKRGRKNYKRKFKQYVPGYGGMVGRFVGSARKAYTTKGSWPNWALKKVKQLADAVNIEYKYIEPNNTATGVDYDGVLYALNTVSQGVTDNTRIGDSLKVQRLTMRYAVKRNSADSLIRVIVLWEQIPTLSTPADVINGAGGTNAPLGPKVYDNRFKTRFLYDRTFALSSNNSIKNVDVNLPINLHTQYSAGSTTITTGKLWLLVISDQITSNLPTFQYLTRVTYTDD